VPFSGLVEEAMSERDQVKVRVWVMEPRGMQTWVSWLAPGRHSR
jgi:hypothetical protein